MSTRISWSLSALVVIGLALSQSPSNAAPLKFWNLTSATIVELSLAAPGTNKWGPNQCENDADKSVDADERLVLKDVTPGKYDVRLKQKSGLTCIVKNVEVRPTGPYAFSIEETELKNCSR